MKQTQSINETYLLLELLDYTKSEIEYGICKSLENGHKDDLINWSIVYIERDIKRNPKYMHN